MFKNKHKNLGFTLVELLVVIAIIGILSSVALINMQSARDKAKKTTVLSDLSQNISAIQTCFADEQNLIPPPVGATPNFSLGGGQVCTGSSATWPVVNRDGLDYYYYLPFFASNYATGDTGSFSFVIIEGTTISFPADVRLVCQHPVSGSNPICLIY